MLQVTKRILAVMLVVAAIYTPAASARLVDPARPQVTTTNKVLDEPSTLPNPTVQTSSGGFNWGDAGIGAAAMFTLLTLGTGSLLVVRRRERRPATTS